MNITENKRRNKIQNTLYHKSLYNFFPIVHIFVRQQSSLRFCFWKSCRLLVPPDPAQKTRTIPQYKCCFVAQSGGITHTHTISLSIIRTLELKIFKVSFLNIFLRGPPPSLLAGLGTATGIYLEYRSVKKREAGTLGKINTGHHRIPGEARAGVVVRRWRGELGGGSCRLPPRLRNTVASGVCR